MFYPIPAMRQNFLPLNDEHNVLALLQQGYTFIETSSAIDAEPTFVIGIPHTSRPENENHQMLSKFLMGQSPVTYGVDKSYFQSETAHLA